MSNFYMLVGMSLLLDPQGGSGSMVERIWRVEDYWTNICLEGQMTVDTRRLSTQLIVEFVYKTLLTCLCIKDEDVLHGKESSD